ncbi:uncharacterized protein LOC101855574 [Aplysia californica]|uniref:Uncharacterized protein LOC101855574 n=1 Tax=Aplysia californica TaxID=6500 RepID=A0ABM1A2U4_APLCA|nr:uncharacterized protein LOC101855574 [Aplysia californica]
MRPPGLDSVMASQAVANTLTDTDVCNDIDYLNFTISTTPTAGTGCTPGPLGMASGVIQNCQISSSHYSLSGKGPTKGRLNDVTGWSPFVHNGQVRKERYFQVYFGNKMLVSKVQLQQTGSAKVTAMAVGHSNDGVAWVKYPENVMSPDPSLSDETLDIPSPQVARYIRLYITDQDNNGRAASLRFEFIGCQSSTDGPSGPCQAADPVPIGDFKMRSFLVAAGTVYVCDGTQGDKGIQQRCYSSTDGRTWMDLDSRVGAMVGYESDEPRVYAVSADGMHYMTSADGVVWETGVPDDVTEAKTKATFSSALEVPVDGNPDLDGTPKPAFTQANYAATSVGLKNFNSVTWDNVFNWSTCCP